MAAGPHAKLTPPDDLEFTAAVGASVHKTVELKNDGDGALTLNVTEVVTSGPPFSVDNGCAAKQLAAGEKCNMEVTFAPTAAGVVNGNLSVTVSGARVPAARQPEGHRNRRHHHAAASAGPAAAAAARRAAAATAAADAERPRPRRRTGQHRRLSADRRQRGERL